MVNLIKRFCAVVYMLLMAAAGMVFIVLGLKLCDPELCLELFNKITSTMSGQIVFTFIGGLFLVTGVILTYRMEKALRKKRTVAFQNSDGEVMISISAIEDYVRKIAKNIPEIRDIKSSVDVSRKGINIVAAVSISAGTNIPLITEKIQMEVKNKIQVMLGVEEKMNIKIFVRKIARQDAQNERGKMEEMSSSAIPYREAG